MGLLEGLNELINFGSLGTCCSPALLRGWDRIPGGDCELGPSLGRGWPLNSGLSICGLLTHVSEKAGAGSPLSRCPQAAGEADCSLFWSTVCERGLDPGTSPLLHMCCDWQTWRINLHTPMAVADITNQCQAYLSLSVHLRQWHHSHRDALLPTSDGPRGNPPTTPAGQL